eukprot:10571436-Ditylum_brightwellii.AAC.1
MSAHCMAQQGRVSFAETCRKLSQDNADSLAMINTAKHFKVESQQKYRTKHYRIQKKVDVMHKDLKMGWLSKNPKIKIARGRGKYALRQIPCACIECINKSEKPWVHGVSPIKQPRHAK